MAIIEVIMQELEVSDIEDLPAKVIELKGATQHMHTDAAPDTAKEGEQSPEVYFNKSAGPQPRR